MGLAEVRYKVVGMTCQSCAVSVETMLQSIEGVEKAQVDFAAQEVWVRHDPEKAPLAKLQSALAPAGYVLLGDATAAALAHRQFLKRLRRYIYLSGGVTLLGMLGHWGMEELIPEFHAKVHPWWGWVYFGLSLGLVLTAGRIFWRAAWQQLRYRQLSMDTLISLGLWGSVALSFFTLWVGQEVHTEAAAEILFFVLIGRYLEERARLEAASTREALSALASPYAIRVHEDKVEETIPTEYLRPGDLIHVRKGEILPADGYIESGEGHLQEALLTGEALPQWRTVGERVLAGTTLLAGDIYVRVTHAAVDSFLSQLIARLERAQATRAKAQRLADRVSAVFVPVVLFLSVVAFGIALWRGRGWVEGGLRLLSVLVISCPCALGLATPLAVQIAIGRSARRQILLREVAQLENLPLCTLWAFDKTGTLTKGSATLTHETWWAPEWKPQLAYLLSQSEHPLAQAIGHHLRQSTTPKPLRVLNQVSFPGRGVLYQTEIGPLYVGHPRWLKKRAPDFPQPEGTAIGVLSDKGPVALFVLEDPPRLELKPFLEELRARGIRTVLLSGDPSTAPQKVGAALGFTEIWGGLSPTEKAEWIQKAREEGYQVAFVGDGLNDTLALQAAQVGIAVYRSAGAAVHSAGISLLAPTEEALPELYRLSRKLRRVIAQNLAWAFGYNLVALPAAMGLIPGMEVSPAVSALLMSVSSVTVVLNSLRLRR
ncbi:MAG: cation-translocating P-type ATPase [Bacteroidota bacterium]|nr:cation-translocating P-type ATPase [Bacteroidota bacterium]